jgi:hypothetical protein
MQCRLASNSLCNQASTEKLEYSCLSPKCWAYRYELSYPASKIFLNAQRVTGTVMALPQTVIHCRYSLSRESEVRAPGKGPASHHAGPYAFLGNSGLQRHEKDIGTLFQSIKNTL